MWLRLRRTEIDEQRDEQAGENVEEEAGIRLEAERAGADAREGGGQRADVLDCLGWWCQSVCARWWMGGVEVESFDAPGVRTRLLWAMLSVTMGHMASFSCSSAMFAAMSP